MTGDQILIFLAGFLWMFLTSLQTVFISRRLLIPLGFVAFITSVIVVFIVYQIARKAQEMWLAYSLGTSLGAVIGCWAGHKLGELLKRGEKR